MWKDLLDDDENRVFQLNKFQNQQKIDDVPHKPEIVIEIIQLHRSITESVCKETKLEHY